MQNGLFLSSSQNIGATLSQYISKANNTAGLPTSTGSIALDDLLSGGIKSNAIYEISGLLNSGKLQLVFNIVDKFLEQDKRVLWIDTSSKIPLNDLIKLNDFESSHLTGGNLHHTRIDYLIQLVVLMKQLGKSEPQDAYSLIVVNEFSDLVHSSFLVLEDEINKRKKKIEDLRDKMNAEKKEREKFGETFTSRDMPAIQGPSVAIRQNNLIHKLLGLMTSYNEKSSSSFILLGSLNTASQKLLLEGQSASHKNSSRHLTTVYQSKLVPILGEECPWLGLLESRIVLYKDWKERINVRDMDSVKGATTITSAILKFNRPVISNDLNYPTRRVIKTTKSIRFKVTSEGIEDVDNFKGSSVVGITGTQLSDSVDLNDDINIILDAGAASYGSFENDSDTSESIQSSVRKMSSPRDENGVSKKQRSQ